MLEDRGSGARCAVKRIDMRKLSERKRAQALAESDHLRSLVHPCVCGFYGSFVEAQVRGRSRPAVSSDMTHF